MEPTTTSIETKIAELDQKISAIYKSVEQTRKMILWTGIITIAVFVLPLIGLLLAIPSYLNQLNQIQNLGL